MMQLQVDRPSRQFHEMKGVFTTAVSQHKNYSGKNMASLSTHGMLVPNLSDYQSFFFCKSGVFSAKYS